MELPFFRQLLAGSISKAGFKDLVRVFYKCVKARLRWPQHAGSNVRLVTHFLGEGEYTIVWDQTLTHLRLKQYMKIMKYLQ